MNQLVRTRTDSEKITLNLGFVDLGQIDLLVKDGFYANRTDLIRTAIRNQLDRETASYGISVVDVRIRRADLPEQNSQAVYQRMQTERQREAAEFRAQGGQKAQEIRSKADREATVIIADANSQAEQVRGEGDGERNRLFAEAYGKDADFFAFYRSMTAYENSMKSNDTRFLLRPDSEFFRYFANPAGKPAAANGSAR